MLLPGRGRGRMEASRGAREWRLYCAKVLRVPSYDVSCGTARCVAPYGPATLFMVLTYRMVLPERST
eukprot:1134012-Rhodomonas_salina.3